MGHEILYCAGCQTQLRSADFEKAKAFRIDSHAYCKKCVPEDRLNSVPESPPPAASSKERGNTSRIPLASVRRSPLEGDPAGGSPPIPRGAALGIAAVVGVGVVALFLLSRGGTPPPAAEGPRAGESRPREAEPVRLSPPKNPIPPPPEEKAVVRPPAPVPESLRAARAYLQAHPQDIDAAIALYEKALEETRETVHFKPARQEIVELYDRDFASVDREAGQAVLREEFGRAFAALEAAKKKRSDPAWQRRIENSVSATRTQVQERLAQLRASALEAWRSSRDDDFRKARDRVTRWGLEETLKEFDQAVAKAPPRPPPPSAEAAGYLRSWEEAWVLAAGRDYDGARKVLAQAATLLHEEPVRAEAAADLDFFRAAGAAIGELLQRASKWPKDRKLKVTLLEESGTREVEGTVVRANAFRAELGDGGTVEWGEATPASLAAALGAASDAKPAAEPRSLLLLSLIDGDLAGAKALAPDGAGSVPEKYWKRGGRGSGADPRQADASQLFHTALLEVRQPTAAAEGLAKFQRLLKEYSETPVVRRNRMSILDWSQRAGREYLFLTEDLVGHGAFRLAKGPKGEPGWISQSEQKQPEQAKENYVEFAFSAVADAEYRCWAYVGGCCAETLTFACQGTELKSIHPKTRQPDVAEPGSELFVPVRQTLLTSIRTHAGHGGPRQPSRWGWVAIPMPKYSQAGVKTVRLLSGEQGFAVGFAFVTSLPGSPPPEAEVREAEKVRATRAPAGGQAGAAAVKPPGRLVFSENFGAGPGRFTGGEIADGGTNGTKALAFPPAGIFAWGFMSVPGKETVRIRFKVKASVDVERIQVLIFSDRLKDNGRYYIEGLRKDEWRDVEFGPADLRVGPSRDGPNLLGDTINNLKMFYAGDASARVLMRDLEVRE